MVGLSTAGEAAVIAAIATTSYVSLHTADPGDFGSNELSGGAYARQGPVPFTNVGNNPTIASNSTIISYPTATTNWGVITHFGIWSAVTAGVFEGSGVLTSAKTVNSGDQVRFLANGLTLTAN